MSKPTIPQPLFPGDRATAPMALEDASETTWRQFEQLLSNQEMGFDQAKPDEPAHETIQETLKEDARDAQATVPTESQQQSPRYAATEPMQIPASARAAAPKAARREITVDDLMTLARRNNRSCPIPAKWAEFHALLPTREHQGKRIPAPPPIEGAAWSASSPMQKRLRLRDQIEWADRAGALVAAGEFLAALSEEQWFHF